MKRAFLTHFLSVFCSILAFGPATFGQPATSYEDAERWGASLLSSLEKENVAHPMQYVVLREGASFKSQVVAPYTIYEVRSAFDLGGETFRMPAHSILSFNGGRIRNGRLVADDTRFCVKTAQAATFNCDTTGTFGQIDFIVKASEAGMTRNISRGAANYMVLRNLVRQGVNLYLDGSYPVAFASPIVLDRVFHLFGGSLVFEKNAFRFANGGGLVVDGSSIVASTKSRSAFFCGSTDLMGAVRIKRLSFLQSTIDCAYLAHLLYEDLNSDTVSFGVDKVEIDHCVLEQTGRVRIMDAVIADKCSITNNHYKSIATTPIYIACQHSVEGSPNDKTAYRHVKENLTKGCPVVIDRNIFIGSPVQLNFYFCAALVKAVDCSFTNNYIRDIINYTDGKENSLATAYDSYLSCVNVLYEGNFVKDVMSYTRKGGSKPKAQIGKSKTNPLGFAGMKAERIYKNNCFLVDGDRFLKMGADAESLNAEIFGNVSYIDNYVWSDNTVIYRKAQVKTGVSTLSYGTFTFENNYFEAESMTGNGIITTRSHEPMERISICNNTFKLTKSQLFPVYNQRYNEKYVRGKQKEIVITDNTFVNCAPKVFYHTGEQVTIKNNVSDKGDVSGNLYLSKFSGSGTNLDVTKMDTELKFTKTSANAGGLFQYFSSDSHGRYSIDVDQIPEKGLVYTYMLNQNHSFAIVLTVTKGRNVQEYRIPFRYSKGNLSYEWQGRTVKVSPNQSDAVVWFKGDGVQFRTSFYASGKKQVVTRVQRSGAASANVRYKLTYQAE